MFPLKAVFALGEDWTLPWAHVQTSAFHNLFFGETHGRRNPAHTVDEPRFAHFVHPKKAIDLIKLWSTYHQVYFIQFKSCLNNPKQVETSWCQITLRD